MRHRGSTSRLLAAAPDARLVLKSSGLDPERYGRHLAAAGLPLDRIQLLGMTPDVASHLACYAGMDVALDPFPYNGTTTTCEALWMGVPVITRKGDNHRSRVGYSLLEALALDDELVVDGAEAYIARAVSLAAQPQKLIELRASLRARMSRSPLRDEVGFTRLLEETYRGLWRRWCDGPPTTMLKPPRMLRPEDSIQGVLIKTL